MNWNSIDWDKLRKEVMRKEETELDDVNVYLRISDYKTDTHDVVYEIGERCDYIPTGMNNVLSAIGYAICYLENEIHEQEVSDCMPNCYSFTMDELYMVKYKLNKMLGEN